MHENGERLIRFEHGGWYSVTPDEKWYEHLGLGLGLGRALWSGLRAAGTPLRHARREVVRALRVGVRVGTLGLGLG